MNHYQQGTFFVRILLWKRNNAPGDSRHPGFLAFLILRYVWLFSVGFGAFPVMFVHFNQEYRRVPKSGFRLTFWCTYWLSYCFRLNSRCVPKIGFSADIPIDMFIDILTSIVIDTFIDIFIDIFMAFPLTCCWHFRWPVDRHAYWHFQRHAYWHAVDILTDIFINISIGIFICISIDIFVGFSVDMLTDIFIILLFTCWLTRTRSGLLLKIQQPQPDGWENTKD